MMSRYTSADVNVIALIGERGREVNDFLERSWPRRIGEKCRDCFDRGSDRVTTGSGSVDRHRRCGVLSVGR